MTFEDFEVGDVVRISADGDYHDERWAGALAIVTGGVSRSAYGDFVKVRRIADGVNGEIVSFRVERPEEAPDEGG